MRLKSFLLIATAVIMLTSCSIFKPDHFARDQQAAQLFYLQNPGELAKVCAQQFPVQGVSTSLSLDTLRPAVNINYQVNIDSLKSLADMATKLLMQKDVGAENFQHLQDIIKNLQQEIAGLKASYKPCAPDTVKQTRTIRVKDMAAIDSLSNYINKQRAAVTSSAQELADAEATSSQKTWIIAGLGALCLVLLIFLIRGKL